MTQSWLETAIIIFIGIGLATVIWRGGAANPETAGRLARRIGKLDEHVGQLDGKVTGIEAEVRRIDDHAASKADIRRLERAVAGLEKLVAEMGRDAASREATLDHVKQQVDRIVGVIVNKGMNA